MPKRRVQAMIHALVRQGYLRQEGLKYPTLALTDEGREIMHNRTQARLGEWELQIIKRSKKPLPPRWGKVGMGVAAVEVDPPPQSSPARGEDERVLLPSAKPSSTWRPKPAK